MKQVNLKLFLLLAALAFGFSLKANTGLGDDSRPLHEIHSMMMYNFMKYTKWPAAVESNSKFKIAIIGDKDLHNTLVSWYGTKKRGSQSYDIKYYGSVSEAPVDAQVIYLASNKSKEFETLKQKIEGKPVLTVTDGNGLAKKGSNINFKVVNGKLKFEMNTESVANANLQISSSLQSLAIII
ncbi:MAG: YfiR family protein [Bacteroidota bacterium]